MLSSTSHIGSVIGLIRDVLSPLQRNHPHQTLVAAGLTYFLEYQMNNNLNIARNQFAAAQEMQMQKERAKQLRLKQFKDIMDIISSDDVAINPTPYTNLIKLIGAEQSPLQRQIMFNLRRVASEELFTWIKKETERPPVTSPRHLNNLMAECAIDLLSNTYKFLNVTSYKELRRAADPDHPSGWRQFGNINDEELAEWLLTQAIAMMMISLPDNMQFNGADGLLANTINKLLGSTIPCRVPEAPEAAAVWDRDPWEDEGAIQEDPLETLIAREEAWDD